MHFSNGTSGQEVCRTADACFLYDHDINWASFWASILPKNHSGQHEIGLGYGINVMGVVFG